LVKIVKKVDVQNEKNYSDSSWSSKSDTVSESTDSYYGQKRNPRQIKSNVNDTLNDAYNLEDFEDTCVNTAPI